MSLQPSSQPEARSLIVFLLSVLSPLLTQFTDFQDKVRDLPRRGRGPRSPGSGSGSTSRPDQARLGSHFQHQLPKNTSGFCFSTFPMQGFRGQNKFIFKGCRKASGKKGLVSLKIFSLNQLKIRIF